MIWVSDYMKYDIQGVDGIWHNQYRGDLSDFGVFRKFFDHDVNWMLKKVSSHVEAGMYRIVSMSASAHSMVVVCICDKKWEDMPVDMFSDE